MAESVLEENEASVTGYPYLEDGSVSHQAVTLLRKEWEQVLTEGDPVIGLRFSLEDPAANWLKGELAAYMLGKSFAPAPMLDEQGLREQAKGKTRKLESNTNFAFNVNDKTAVRKEKKS